MKNIGDYESIYSVNPLYFIIGEVDGYIEEKNGDKYFEFAYTNKNKDALNKIQNFGMGLKIWLNAIPLKK